MSKRSEKIGKSFGFSFIFFGLIFLFNPDIAIVDVLPDFFGYILITVGFRYLRDICPHTEKAREGFAKMILISFLKLVSVVFVFGLTNFDTRPTTLLLLAFGFGVIEIIYALPAWNALFDGLVYLAQRTSGDVALKSDRFGRDYTTKIKKATVFFIFAKIALCVLPEFSSLSMHMYDDTAFDWSRYIGLFRVFAFAAMSVIGTVWLVRTLKYFYKLSKDSAFINGLRDKYRDEVLPKTGFFIRKHLKMSLILVFIASALCCDLYFSISTYSDVLNFLPDLLCGAAFVGVFAVLWRYSAKNARRGVILASAYTVVSLASWIATVLFVRNNSYPRIWKAQDAYNDFFSIQLPLSIVENILFVLTVFALVAVLRAIIKDHCGYLPDTLSEEYRNNRIAAILREMNAKIYPVIIFAVISALCDASMGLVMSIPGFAAGEGRNFLLILSEVWWIVSLVVSAVFKTSFAISSSISEYFSAFPASERCRLLRIPAKEMMRRLKKSLPELLSFNISALISALALSKSADKSR